MTFSQMRPAEKGLILLVLTVIAYFPALQAGYIWDDPYHVTDNPLLHTPLGLWRIWFEIGAHRQYYPLTLSVFWAGYQLWGLEPFYFHLLNVLLHAANAVLVWRLCRRLSLPAPWLAGAVFALHPVMVESVAWITELKNVLSSFFYLLSAHAMVGYFRMDVPQAHAKANDRTGWDYTNWSLGLLFFASALCSKSITATLPAALLVVIWMRTGSLKRKHVLALLPFFVLGAAYGLLTVSMEQDLGAMGARWDFSFADRFLIAGRALWFYLGKLLWPADLVFNYQRWVIDDTDPWQYAYPCGFLLLLAAAWAFRNKMGRGLLAALLFFAGTLFPALGFFNVYPMQFSFVADHFQYLASLGPIILCTCAAAAWVRRQGEKALPIGRLAAFLLLALMSLQTFDTSIHYTNSETLYKWILQHNKDSYLANYNLGSLMLDWNRYEEAVPYLKESIRLRPGNASGHNNLGIAYGASGKLREAADQFAQAYERDPFNKKTLSNLVLTSLRMRAYDDASRQIETYLRKWPHDTQFLVLTGNALRKQGQFSHAASLCSRVPPSDANAAPARQCVDLAKKQDMRTELAP